MFEAFYGAVDILPTGTIRGFLNGWEAMLAAAPAPDGMREAIVAIINEEVDGDYDGRLHYVGAAADAILAIIAKGEGR
jgi:hypothetical protein